VTHGNLEKSDSIAGLGTNQPYEAFPSELIKIVCHFSGYILNFHSALYLSGGSCWLMLFETLTIVLPCYRMLMGALHIGH